MNAEAVKTAPQKVIVATTVALSFISFWRAASIVLCDLASSMFYVGGITEQAVGKSAPWLVLGVMFFSFAVRSIYLESSSMYVRGGVYVVVKESMGALMARLSVSALVFDYLLTGPISSVSAGQYVGRLVNEVFEMAHFDFRISPAMFSVFFALLVTAYFWRANIRGIHESSHKALRIMQATTIMVVALLIWCPVTLFMQKEVSLPPLPSLETFSWGHHALGWFEGTFWPGIASIAMVIAFGHAFLSMSGFETLAQVYREINYPKLKNLKITGNIVCVYALVSTGLITLFAGLIIPDAVRPDYFDNLIGGLSMHLYGPLPLRIAFHAFVVVVGALILSAAVNTSLIGANAVLNRVAEDGVLLPWFRKPHKKFGTTFRIIHLVGILQVLTILLSQGDVYLLGEAYAFGVVWSFCLKSCGVLALRFQRDDQEYKTPGNVKIGNKEIPVGLMVVTGMLFLVALANLISKQVATIWGISFTILLFVIFSISDRVNRRITQLKKDTPALEQFNLEPHADLTTEVTIANPGATLVAVRDFNNLNHLQWVLYNSALYERGVVVMTARAGLSGQGEHDLRDDQYFSEYEQELFSSVVTMAEKSGRTVDLLLVPARRPLAAVVQTAAKLRCSTIVIGTSAVFSVEELARVMGLAWEKLPEPRPHLSLYIVGNNGEISCKPLGPHTPRLDMEDIRTVHRIWLKLTDRPEFGAQLHHDAVVRVALQRLEKDLQGNNSQSVVSDVAYEIAHHRQNVRH